MDCGAIIYVKKRSIWNKLLVKEHIVCRSVSGPSTVRWCQKNIGPISCRVASLPEGGWRQPPAGRYTVVRWAAGGPIYICWMGISPLLPGPRVAGAANDWCINVTHIAWGCRRQLGSEVQSCTKNMKGEAHFSLSLLPHSSLIQKGTYLYCCVDREKFSGRLLNGPGFGPAILCIITENL